MNKLAFIPLLGVLFTMAPLAAFADTPSIVISPSLIYSSDKIHNFDDNNGDGVIDWTCSGLGNDGNGHYYVAVLIDPAQAETVEIGSCSNNSRINTLTSIEGIGEDGTGHVFIYDNNAIVADQMLDNPQFTGAYDSFASTTAPWYVGESTFEMNSEWL